MMIFPRVPLNNLQTLKAQNISIRANFVGSTQHIITDIYNRWEANIVVPYNLQAALTFRAAFLCFARCCKNGTFTVNEMQINGRPFFDFPHSVQDYKWEKQLWAFIMFYEQGDRDRLEEFAARPADLPPVLPDVNAKHQSDAMLRVAIDKVTGSDRPPYFT